MISVATTQIDLPSDIEVSILPSKTQVSCIHSCVLACPALLQVYINKIEFCTSFNWMHSIFLTLQRNAVGKVENIHILFLMFSQYSLHRNYLFPVTPLLHDIIHYLNSTLTSYQSNFCCRRAKSPLYSSTMKCLTACPNWNVIYF